MSVFPTPLFLFAVLIPLPSCIGELFWQLKVNRSHVVPHYFHARLKYWLKRVIWLFITNCFYSSGLPSLKQQQQKTSSNFVRVFSCCQQRKSKGYGMRSLFSDSCLTDSFYLYAVSSQCWRRLTFPTPMGNKKSRLLGAGCGVPID